jgi:hypothetical protein
MIHTVTEGMPRVWAVQLAGTGGLRRRRAAF